MFFVVRCYVCIFYRRRHCSYPVRGLLRLDRSRSRSTPKRARRPPARAARQHARPQSGRAPELMRREHRGTFAFLGDLVDLGRRAAPPAGADRAGQSEVPRRRCLRPQRDAGGASCILAFCLVRRGTSAAAAAARARGRRAAASSTSARARPPPAQVRRATARRHRPVHPHHARRPQHPQRPGDHRQRNRRPGPHGIPQADGRTGARLAGRARAARPGQARAR